MLYLCISLQFRYLYRKKRKKELCPLKKWCHTKSWVICFKSLNSLSRITIKTWSLYTIFLLNKRKINMNWYYFIIYVICVQRIVLISKSAFYFIMKMIVCFGARFNCVKKKHQQSGVWTEKVYNYCPQTVFSFCSSNRWSVLILYRA